MGEGNSSLRERLLARLPRPENFAAYREEVVAGLEKNEKRFHREKWRVRAFWLYVVAFILFTFYRGQEWLATPNGHKWELASIVLLICGAMELLKHSINRSRVEALMEVKQLQLQVLQLQASLQKTADK